MMASSTPLLILIFVIQLSESRFVALELFQLLFKTAEHVFHWCAELVKIAEFAPADC
jgi:hypothetical protein